MTPQAYFSARPIAINSHTARTAVQATPRLTKHERSTSAESMTSIRSFLRPWCPDINTPPSSRTVSFSSWTRFNATAVNTPPGELKASVLWKASGTTPTYDPPASEWTFLGFNQPVYEFQPFVKKSAHRRQKSSESWTSTSSTGAGDQAGTITFSKQKVKRVSTSSQLTASLNSVSPGGSQGAATTTANRFGLGGMTSEDLPSAFESDEEEDEE
tara:strand:+ start:272 stop:913 length:642 start_codon:yes stop_codon:yes gene_type:complete